MWRTESVEVGRAGSASSSVSVASDAEAARLSARWWPLAGATAALFAAVSSSSSEDAMAGYCCCFDGSMVMVVVVGL